MKISLHLFSNTYHTDLHQGRLISTIFDPAKSTPKCFWAPDVKVEPVRTDSFIGDIDQGGIVNFKNIFINPHGNGTHTECVGHIISGDYYVSEAITHPFYVARLISIQPDQMANGDLAITETNILQAWQSMDPQMEIEALVIRTLPNEPTKQDIDYSGSNPTYIDVEAIRFINNLGIKHLIVDLPSIDREEDGGALAGHKAFWGVDIEKIDTKKTITELVYIDNDIKDDVYLCQISPMMIKSDASPSTIILYPLAMK
jgi:arylformamidase